MIKRPDASPARCPGSGTLIGTLASLDWFASPEIVIEALLARTQLIRPLADRPPVRAVYPSAGFTSLPLWIESADSG